MPGRSFREGVVLGEAHGLCVFSTPVYDSLPGSRRGFALLLGRVRGDLDRYKNGSKSLCCDGIPRGGARGDTRGVENSRIDNTRRSSFCSSGPQRRSS